MDVIQGTSPRSPKIKTKLTATDYALNAYTFYNSCDPYLRPIRQGVSQLQTQFQARAYPLLLPYLNRALVLAQDSPGILTIGVLLLFLLIAMQILNFVRRVMMFWVRLITRVVFYSAIVMVGAAVWQRGLGRTVDDLMAWGQELNEVWWREYRRWEGYQNQAKAGTGTRGGSRWP